MEIGTALLIGMFVNLFGLALYFELKDRSYFRRENFKIMKYNTMQQNKLTIKKMAKEMGVTVGKDPPAESKSLLDSLKGLDLDKVKGLLDLVGSDEEGEEDMLGGLGSGLMNYVKDNPDTVKSFLAGLNTNKKEDNGIIYEN